MNAILMRRWTGVAVLALSLAMSGCGYSLAGRGSFIPAYIRVIGVPQFVDHSSPAVFDLDRNLTQKVRQEFQGRGRYQVVPDKCEVVPVVVCEAGIDAVLSATITSVAFSPVAFDQNRQATRNEVIVTVNVIFTDLHTNKVVWSNPALAFRKEFAITDSTKANDPTAFFGENANALDLLGTEFARSVVTSILENF